MRSDDIDWKPRHFGDARDNAAIILQCSNACLFKFDKNVFSCAYCPFSCPEFAPIRIHTEQLHKDKAEGLKKIRPGTAFKLEISDLRCELCETSIIDLPTLHDHLVKVHEKGLIDEIEVAIFPYHLSNGYNCFDCGLIFDRFSNLNRHVNEHYPNHVCTQCGQAFSTQSRLKSHTKMVHRTKPLAFKCTICDEIFPREYAKQKHLREKHNILVYKCPYCDKKFLKYQHRSQHLNEVHGQEISYPCNVCHKVFAMSQARANHIRSVHLRERRHVCQMCDSSFYKYSGLKRHMVKHSDEKNFECTVCKKAYARKKTLNEHMRIHNDDRRYACEHCGFAFVQKSSLQRHVKSLHSNAEAPPPPK